ncbi:hypothetical protein ACWGTO_32845, partial [Mesorhizobium sp. PL10]
TGVWLPTAMTALQKCIRLAAGFVPFVMAMLVSATAASGQETSLVGIHQGSELTEAARRLGQGGYELRDGTWVSLDKWFHSSWIDMRFEMLTQLSDDFGLLWSASTGQRAEKLRIEPKCGTRLCWVRLCHCLSRP